MKRRVESTDTFWEEVSTFFPQERDGQGGASIADFQVIVLPAIEFQLARGYDESALVLIDQTSGWGMPST